jgi:TonB family protein
MKPLPLFLTLFCLIATGLSQTPATRDARSAIVYAPEPEYPIGAARRGWQGSGLFLCRLRPDGGVSSVIVLQNTGYDLLDGAGISAFQRWRFKPGLLKAVKIPLNFTMRHGIRHRMAGAVIAD